MIVDHSLRVMWHFHCLSSNPQPLVATLITEAVIADRHIGSLHFLLSLVFQPIG